MWGCGLFVLGPMTNQIRILLTLDGKQYEADLSGATAKTKQFGQEAERAGSRGTALASALRSLGIGFSAFTAVQVIKQISQTGIAFEQMRLALTSISAGSGEAADRFQFVANEAQRLGVDIETAVLGYTRLAAATRGTNLEGEATERIFSAVSEASARLSLSTADAAGVMRALAQIASKGTLSAEELRQQLGDRLPGAFQIAADAMGVTTAKLNEMLQKGEIASEDFLPKFADAMSRTFGTDSTTRIESTQASFSRLTSQIKLMVDVIAQDLNPVLASAADALAAALENARRARQITPDSIGGMSDAELAEFGLSRRGGPLDIGIDAPFTTPGAGLAARYAGRFSGPGAPQEPDFYGYSPPAAMDEDQQERADLLREELALMGMRTEEEKAYYQITEGRYRDQPRQIKELVLEIAKEHDAKKQLLETEKAAKREAEEQARILDRLRQTYDPYGEQVRQLALDQEALTDAYARGAIEMPEYLLMLEAVNQAQDRLIENTQNVAQAQYDLQLAYVSVAEEGLGVLRMAAGESRSTQLALLTLEKSLAIARILISTEVAAMRAMAETPGAAGEVMAARIRSLGYVSIGLVAAAGAIEAGQISGGRERGGPVKSGGIYEVGERGRPELLESGGRYFLLPGNKQGQVSPARSAGGMSGTIVQIHNSSGAPARTEKSRMSDGRELVRVFIGEANRDLAENGPLARGISSTFGLQRRTVTR